MKPLKFNVRKVLRSTQPHGARGKKYVPTVDEEMEHMYEPEYRCEGCGEPTDMIQPYCDECERTQLIMMNRWTAEMEARWMEMGHADCSIDERHEVCSNCGTDCSRDPCINPHDLF